VTLFATGEWSRAVVRWWGVVVLAWVLAALPLWTGGPSPEPEGVLVPAALGLAMIAAVGAGSFLGEIRRAGLGWRQAAAVGAGALLLVGALGFLGDVVGGRFHQPDGDWPAALSWMELQTDRGPFRVLWVGSPGAVPGALHRVGPDAYAMTVNGSGDLRDALPPPGGAGDRAAAREVRALTVGTSTRLGQAVAPMAVRYVVLPTRPGPGPARRTAATARLGARLAQQLDLRELQGTPGASIYENLAWVPADAVLAGDVPRGPARAPLGAVRGRIGPSAPAGTALWSQQYSDAWRAETGGGSVDHRRAAGWANAFTGPGRVTRVTFADQWWRWPAVLVELVIVAVLGGEALRRRRRHRRGRRRSRPAARTDSGVDA